MWVPIAVLYLIPNCLISFSSAASQCQGHNPKKAPEEVRKVFLDFAQLPKWTKGFISSIKPANGDDAKLEPSEKLNCVIGGMSIKPTILVNDDREFQWRGVLFNIPGLFIAVHVFRFEPSKTTPGGTRFVQEETFSGVLSFLTKEGRKMETDTRKKFEAFNEDLKARCERELVCQGPRDAHVLHTKKWHLDQLEKAFEVESV